MLDPSDKEVKKVIKEPININISARLKTIFLIGFMFMVK
jgi:hypothetical protein